MQSTTARIGIGAPEISNRSMAAATALLAVLVLGGCGGGEEGGPARADAEMPVDTAAAAAETDRVASGLLNPNEASEAALRGIQGLPEDATATLLESRPFADVVALDRTLSAHMDGAARTELYRRVWIPIDLNEASDEAILLIPGVGDRMLHEFKEYRPYRAMAEFRREIGKYVDDEEVARLERYVTLGGTM